MFYKHHSSLKNCRGGGFHPPCKKELGGFYPSCKKHEGDYIHVYKNDQGGFYPGGILPYTRITII